MRICLDLAVFGQDRTLQDTGRRNQQLVGWIAMEGLWQLSGFHHDLRIEGQKGDARRSQRPVYPKPDLAIELQSSVLHKFSDFPTGDDAHAEDAVDTPIKKVAVLRLQSIRLSNPQTQMWVSSRITGGRPSHRWQQAQTAHETR